MSGQDLWDVCRQIAAEHGAGLTRGGGPGACRSDPLALITGIDAYADALDDMSEGVVDDVEEESPR